MLSRNDIGKIRDLSHKKFRDESSLFVAEGPRIVRELMKGFRLRRLIIAAGSTFSPVPEGVETDIVKPSVLERISSLKTAHEVIAVFEKRSSGSAPELAEVAQRELCLALDSIQNPGNLGTIIRTTSWMGVKHIFCSEDTADVYSPKVLQATMGALCEVRVTRCSLPEALSRCSSPVYGTFLDGDNIYTTPLTNSGVIVIGNEGTGISREVERTVSRRLYIPPYPPSSTHVESLNAGIAAAVTLAIFRGRMYKGE